MSAQPAYHAAHTALWCDGPASAYRTYSPASPRVAATRPRASRSQPTGLDRRRDASTVPATVYATMYRSGPVSVEISSRLPWCAASTHAPAKPAMLTAPTDQATTVRNRLEFTRKT
jgi:hypothetical protein